MSTDTRGLTALVDLTDGDVRSCLNTLQFIKSRTSEVTEKVVRTAAVGMKDGGASLHDVWQNLFVPVSAKAMRKQGVAPGADSKYVGKLAGIISSAGDMDKISQGEGKFAPLSRVC